MKEYLHPRIIENCLRLFENSNYRQAAHTAMVEVEIAFKEKAGEKKMFGQKLFDTYLGDSKGIKLILLNEDMQKSK